MAKVVTGFSPLDHGFRFVNFFQFSLEFRLPLLRPVDLGRIIFGLCGGMCYAALDYFHADVDVPPLDTQPQRGTRLYAYLWRRQLRSLVMPKVPLKIMEWMMRSDEDLAQRTAGAEFAKAKRRIDKGEPAVLLLIRAGGMTSPTQNHQVVATGYELDESSGQAKVFLYDPNHPGKEPQISFSLDPEEAGPSQSTEEPLRGFFVLDYGPRIRGLPLDLEAALESVPSGAPGPRGALSLGATTLTDEDTGPQSGSVLPDEKRSALLKLYDGLRVTDVSDGMDIVNLWDRGNMDPCIRPLWRDTDAFGHRVYGFAHTVRFVPTNRPVTPRSPEEARAFIRHWYREWAPGPRSDTIRDGDFIVIDGQGLDVGYIGSNNALGWIAAGAVGAVTNGGCRDTDELIKQGVPVYSRLVCKTIRPGRLEFMDEQVPVTVGGVMVRPGDLVVADGDGVVVVPIEVAKEVGEYAWEVAEGDKAGRRALYERVGLPMDDTV